MIWIREVGLYHRVLLEAPVRRDRIAPKAVRDGLCRPLCFVPIDGTSTSGRYCREFQQSVVIGGQSEKQARVCLCRAVEADRNLGQWLMNAACVRAAFFAPFVVRLRR
jgi:hypothetical protein